MSAFILGLGILVVQFAMGGSDGDGGDAHDLHGDHDHDSPWLIFGSLRFWSFALLSFGLFGTLLRIFDLAPSWVAFALALIVGFGFGVLTRVVVRALERKSTSSHGTSGDAVGTLGRVIVPIAPEALGKIRVEIRGVVRDYSARSSEAIALGEAVVVEAMDGNDVTVSRAPKELGSSE